MDIKIRHDVYIHGLNDSDVEVFKTTVLAQLRAIVEQGASTMATVQELQDAITKLTADVAAETDVVTSVETTVTGLVALSAAQKAQIADLIAQLAAGGGPVTPEQLQSLLDGANAADAAVLDAKTRLSAAVVKGTPSE